jgi:hypothetical protein
VIVSVCSQRMVSSDGDTLDDVFTPRKRKVIASQFCLTEKVIDTQ